MNFFLWLPWYTYSWFAMTSSKVRINGFLDKIFTHCKWPSFECSLQVSDRYTHKCQIWGSSKFRKSRHIYIAAAMLVGKRMPKVLQILWSITLFSLAQMISNLIHRHTVCSYRPYQNLGEIDCNLHNHIFDYIICQPPIEFWFISKRKARYAHSLADSLGLSDYNLK